MNKLWFKLTAVAVLVLAVIVGLVVFKMAHKKPPTTVIKETTPTVKQTVADSTKGHPRTVRGLKLANSLQSKPTPQQLGAASDRNKLDTRTLAQNRSGKALAQLAGRNNRSMRDITSAWPKQAPITSEQLTADSRRPGNIAALQRRPTAPDIKLPVDIAAVSPEQAEQMRQKADAHIVAQYQDSPEQAQQVQAVLDKLAAAQKSPEEQQKAAENLRQNRVVHAPVLPYKPYPGAQQVKRPSTLRQRVPVRSDSIREPITVEHNKPQ